MAKMHAFIGGWVAEEKILDAIGQDSPATIDYLVKDYETSVGGLTLDEAKELLEWGFNTKMDIKFETA